ncbi:MAG: phosphoglycerate mutase [Thiohalocapsa sp.]
MIRRQSGSRAVFELFAPGLLGPIPMPTDRRPQTPILNLLLARGRLSTSAGTDLASALLSRFNTEASAPYCLSVDRPDWDRSGYWMHADPVHLRPDRDLLRLFDARHLGISQAEADAMVGELNAHFRQDGLEFCAPAASRWYLRCEEPPAITTQPLERAIGQHVDGLLPAGQDSTRWASLVNEAQMLLFQTPVNQRREAAGRPAVSGLWTWGGGVWQAPRLASRLDLIQAKSPLARGLAAAAGITVKPSDAPWPRGAKAVLAIREDLQDAVLDADDRAWAAAAASIDHQLAPVLEALRSRRLCRIVVDACDGRCWAITRSDLRRFWRRTRPIADQASGHLH